MLWTASSARADESFVRCHGEEIGAEGVGRRVVDVVIALARSRDEVLSTTRIADWKLGELKAVLSLVPVGIGRVEASVAVVGSSQPVVASHDFTETQRPTGSNSLIGFYFDRNGYLVSLRADLWEKDKPFMMFMTSAEHVPARFVPIAKLNQ